MRADPLGPPIYWVLPKQATFSAERELTTRSGLDGFCRARVLSFELLGGMRLAVGGSNIFNMYPDQQVKPANVSFGRFIYSRRVTQFGMNGGFYYARLALSL